MTHILILYSSIDGQTKKICQYIANEIRTHQTAQITILPLSEFIAHADFTGYDTLVIGASIRYGKHRKYVHEFVTQYKAELEKRHTGFFSVNLVARKDEKNTATTNTYVTKFLEQTQWQPTVVDVFAGKLDYAAYGMVDKFMIKFIMWLTKGPTSADKPIEFTNWLRVRAFAKKVMLPPQ